VECIPNFSEGRDEGVILAIKASIESVQGVYILHTDIGFDANRTVITFAGHPKAVISAAFNAISTAAELIDMRKHHGEHPRMGATDVCPLVPLRNISMEEVIQLSIELAEQVGNKLGIPVYLYERSVQIPERKNLAFLRKGEYEFIPEKITQPEWKPDFGPVRFNDRSGMTALGARPILIAYNVNLNTTDIQIAKLIAGRIRESGIRNNGERKPRKLKGVKAIGWYMEEYGCAQVSTNITDIEATPIEAVYEAVRQEAQLLNYDVRGSELIGMIPERILINAGCFYGSTTFHETNKSTHIKLAINNLGLNSLSIFVAKDKIIENQL